MMMVRSAFGLLLATQVACPLSCETAPPGRPGGAMAEAPAAQPAVLDSLDRGMVALTESLRARRIEAVDAFTSEDTVIVAFVSPAGGARGSRDELAYVLAAAAVAFPHAERVEAQRYVGERPQSQAHSASVDALDVVAGKRPYADWQRGLSIAPLPGREAILANPYR